MDPLQGCLLRLLRSDGESDIIVGTGFLSLGADGRPYVLTCAHVVNAALGRDKTETSHPGSCVVMANQQGGKPIPLDLQAWNAPISGASGNSDIADIAILTPLQSLSASWLPRLRAEPPSRVVPHNSKVPFHSFGFMVTSDGNPARGSLTAVDFANRFVAHGDHTFRRFIEEGLSGAPVFSDDSRVLGMVARRLAVEDKQGLVISAFALAQAWPLLAMPYPGLPSFEASNAHLFFGRGRPVNGEVPTGKLKELLERLQKQRLVALVGASGSGKSSLANAGVAEYYRQRNWRVVSFRPGLAPLRNLSEAIFEVIEEGETVLSRLQTVSYWESLLKRGMLRDAFDCINRAGADGTLVIVDQFEEFFPGREASSYDNGDLSVDLDPIAQERSLILKQLRQAEDRADVHCLLTVRLDLLESIIKGGKDAARLLSDPYPIFMLTAMTASEVREAIVGPAQVFGVETDTNFATNLAAEVTKGEGRLPLLQEALRQCWARIRFGEQGWNLYQPEDLSEGKEILLLEESVGRRGDEAMGEIERHYKPVEVNRMLLSLVRWVDGRPLRRILSMMESDESDVPMIAMLANQRLVILSGDGSRRTAELVHEALMTRWARLASLISNHHVFLEWRDRFDREFIVWERGRCEEKDLLRRHDVQLAMSWKENVDGFFIAPTSRQLKFIDESYLFYEKEEIRREEDFRQKEKQNRRIRKWLLLSIFALFLFFIFLCLSIFTFKKAQDETYSAQMQESRALAVLARQESEKGDQGTAILLALEGLPDPGFGGKRPLSPEAATMLRQAWLRNREVTTVGYDGPVRVASLSSDGQRVVVASDDEIVRVWDLSAPKSPGINLGEHQGSVFSANLSPDGQRAVTASYDGIVLVWDLSAPKFPAITLAGSSGSVLSGRESVSFSPDGQRVLKTSEDGTAQVWDLSSSKIQAITLGERGHYVQSASFSPDGRRVVTASSDGAAQVWDLSAPKTQAILLEGHEQPVQSASFSPDGQKVVTVSSDGTARVWNLSEPKPQALLLDGHKGLVQLASFSPDGQHVVTASGDTARVWDLSAPKSQAFLLEGHEGSIQSASFSPDGRRVVTGSGEGTVRVWDLSAPKSQPILLRGHLRATFFARFSADGRSVVTASYDGTARVWAVPAVEPGELFLEGSDDSVRSASFSPDGEHLVTISDDKTVRVWDLSVPKPRSLLLEGYEGSVQSASFSPDGQRLVTVSDDKTARVWDLAEPKAKALILEGDDASVGSASFSPDGRRVVTASYDKTARVWDLSALKPRAITLESSLGWVGSANFSPDGQRVVGASYGGAQIWDLSVPERPKLCMRLKQLNAGLLQSASFSPDGGRVVTVSDGGTRVVDLSTPKSPPITLGGRLDRARSASFSPDGQRVLTASYDGTARVWDLAGSQASALVLGEYSSSMLYANFSRDGRRVLTFSSPNKLRVWDVYPDIRELSSLVRKRLTRCLSTAQREEFGLRVEDRKRNRDAIPIPDSEGNCPR
ncbi:nSTAND1 domain-containing NTPase [Rhodospirillum rubrum]|nr:trypsin-like peptidase domain-containing protein [Rhodospirillum rubrum]